MLQIVYRNKSVYVIKSLNDSERDVKTLKMIQGVSSLQVLKIQKQLQKVARDHQMTTVDRGSFELYMGYDWLHSLWRLGKKFCTKFVPRSLMDEQKEQRVTNCKEFIQTCQTSTCDLSYIMNGDEWVVQIWETYKKCVAVKGYYVKETKTVFFCFHVYQFL